MAKHFSSKLLILGLLFLLLASFLPVVATERPTEIVPKAAIFSRESQKPNEQCGVRRSSRPAMPSEGFILPSKSEVKLHPLRMTEVIMTIYRSARFLTAPPLLLITQLIGTHVARDK